MRRAILLGTAFLVLTALVQAGLLRPADRYAIHHLEPLSGGTLAQTVAPPDPLQALRPVVRGERSAVVSIGAIAFVPADTEAAIVLVVAAGVVLRRRGRARPWAWTAALLAGLAVEGLGKRLVDQIHFAPGTTILGVALNGSYPSGHTIRSVILATAAATLWPRARPLLAAWVLLVTGLLELGGLHVPSDIAGGFLAGGALACAAVALQSGGHAALQATGSPHLRQAAGAADGRAGRPGADRGEEQPEAG